jgi:hypothetical protein
MLKALATHLEGIDNLPVFGSTTLASLAGNVFRGRTVFGAEMTQPFISILEARKPDDLKAEVTGPDHFTMYDGWHLLVQGWQPGDPANPTDYLYNFKALVEQRLSMITATNNRGAAAFPQYFRLGGLIPDLQFYPGIVRPASQTTGQVEGFYLPIVIDYAITLSDPFTLYP